MTSVTGRIEGLAVACVDDFMVAIHEESRGWSEAFLRCESPVRVGRMGILVLLPNVGVQDRATSTSESLGWFLSLSILCTQRGIDGSPGFVISKTKTA